MKIRLARVLRRLANRLAPMPDVACQHQVSITRTSGRMYEGDKPTPAQVTLQLDGRVLRRILLEEKRRRGGGDLGLA